MSQLVIWVLCGTRAGDTAQAMELARRIGGEVRAITLAFTLRHHVPNWLAGINPRSVADQSMSALAPPWPDLVIATGKRTAPVAAWIRQQSDGQTIAVQLGRPRLAYEAFDLIVTTPQYGLPAASNVLEVPLPFAAPKTVPAEVLEHWLGTWKELPRPWIAAAIGASKFPLRLGASQLDEFAMAVDGLARRRGGSLLLFDSPRSDRSALLRVRGQVTSPHWCDEHKGPGSPYQAALKLADEFAVTGDSVSMVAEMLATEKPAHVFLLPRWPAPRWRGSYPLARPLARSGVLSPTRDVHHLMHKLIASGSAGDMRHGVAPAASAQIVQAQEVAVQRIRALLDGRRRAGQSS